jgi:diguanylate cyclase (GGDEF)-like protein
MRGIAHRLVLVAVLCAALARPALGLDPRKQMTQYVHDVWTSNDGLPQESVNAITQTPDGYLWVGSQEGLARFDGVTFTTFDSHTTRGVLDNFIHALFTDRTGTLWIGASDGLLRYEGNGRFVPAWNSATEPTTSARQVTEDGAGRLWVSMGSDGTSGPKGLLRYRNGIESILTTKDGLSSNVVSYSAFDRDGNLWLATSNGIDVLAGGRVVRRYTTADGLADNVVRVVLVDRAGTVWAGTEKGLSSLKNGRFSSFTTRDGLADDRILRLLEDRDGVLWIATGRGVNRVIDGKIEPPPPIAGLDNSQIFALFEDREGSLWIGTHVNGLHRLRSAKFTAIGGPEGLLKDSINGIYEDRAGRIWIGTAQSGANILEHGRVRALSKRDGLETNGVRVFREDRDGAMWIGTRNGLQRLADGKVTTWTKSDGLPDDNILSVLRDRRGVLWIGTNRGVARYENGRIVQVSTPRGFPQTVRVIHEDRRGRVWFGGGEGLAWWDGARFRVEPQFAKAHVMSVSEDGDGTMWLGTWSQGLHRLRDGQVTRYTTASGLYDNVAWSLLDDGRGNLWMGSNRGIYRVAKKQLDDFAAKRIATIACTVYGTADGMRRRETNWGTPPAIRARDGRFWFATTGGAVVIDPAGIRTNRLPPPVVLERFVADDREIATGTAAVLPPGTQNIEIHYAGLSLVSPDKVRFRYRLEGYDDDWVDAGARRTAYYTNVDPGTYRFRVIAANDDGVWNETGASVSFRLKPYFRQTPWFYALVVTALIFVGAGLDKLRERHRRIRHQAFHDPLTGLPNRAQLDQRSTLALSQAQKQERSIAILFLDLDGFKRVNDSHGHASGDRLLQLVAARFGACLRPGDMLARIGGDEFAVLLENINDRAVITEIARRIIDAVGQPFVVEGVPARLGVSIGIAVHPDDGAEVKTILQAADRAMYRAKVSGGNAYTFHSA